MKKATRYSTSHEENPSIQPNISLPTDDIKTPQNLFFYFYSEKKNSTFFVFKSQLL